MISEFYLFLCFMGRLVEAVANVWMLFSTLISLNCPVGAGERLVECVNEAAGIIREISLAR